MKVEFHTLLYLSFIVVSEVLCEEKATITIDIQEEINNGTIKNIAEEFPWHVAILRHKEELMRFLCSGTAVSGIFVITAANCVDSVPIKELNVLISPKNVQKFPVQDSKNNEFFAVSKKYYRFHYYPNDLTLETDVVVLKLQGYSTQEFPQLTKQPSTDRLSKHCFAIGWGVQLEKYIEPTKMMDLLDKRCPKTSALDIFRIPSMYGKEEEAYSLGNLLNLRRILSNKFMFKVSQMLNLHTIINHEPYEQSISQVGTCQVNEYALRKRVDLSAKHHYKCLCPDSNQMCLYSRHPNYVTQVDVGSPVFCKVKRGKKQYQSSGKVVSQYVMAGVIANKSLQEIPLLKYNSSMNFMKAINISNFPEFLFSLGIDKN